MFEKRIIIPSFTKIYAIKFLKMFLQGSLETVWTKIYDRPVINLLIFLDCKI